MILYFFYRLAFLTTFMAFFTQLKYTVRKSCAVLSVSMFVIWIVNSVIYEFTNIDFSNSIYPFTVSVPAFMCFFLLSKSDIFKVMFSFFTVCNFGMMTSFMGLLSFYITGSFRARVLIEFAVVLLILIMSVKFFRKPYFKVLDTLKNGWGVLCTVPCLLSAIIYLLLYYPAEFHNRPESIPIIFLIFILMFTVYTVFYLNFENITHYYQLKQDRNLILMQADLQKKEYNAIMDKVAVTKIFRHDMRHHINVINAFLQDKNISEAQKYLINLDSNLSETVIKEYCENYSVNAILSSYIEKAKDEQIEVVTEVHIPKNIKIDNVELGTIFLNAIDNAINACKKVEDPKDRKICIVCKEHYSQIYIQVTNTFAGEIVFDGKYPVSNNIDHGFGTRSIAATAEKHGGIFSFNAENGIFKTTVILNL